LLLYAFAAFPQTVRFFIRYRPRNDKRPAGFCQDKRRMKKAVTLPDKAFHSGAVTLLRGE